MHRPSSRQLRAHRRRRLPSISRGDPWWDLLLCLEHALLLGGLSEAPASENPRAKGRTRRPSIMFWGGDDSGRNDDCHLVECHPQAADLFDGKPVNLKILQIVFSFE